jgi:uncharacterized protein YndB with AHSA1/START domain
MAKTGESYAAARARLLAADQPAEPADRSAPSRRVLATSDETIRRRTGRGWEEWFDLLDDWGAAERRHREIAKWVAEQQGVVPLAWNAQAVAGSYERARGLREVGQHEDGFTVTASRTVAVPVDRLYEAFVDESLRARWLPDGPLRERTAARPKSVRFDWGDGRTRVHVTFLPKGDNRGTVALQHVRLADAAEAARMKAMWRDRIATLKAVLEQ